MSELRILFIGEAPSKESGGALEGRCGHRLAKLSGLTDAEFYHITDRLNLMPDWPAGTWEGSRASFAAMMLAYELPAYDTVVLCGRRVAAAFGLRNAKWLKPYREVSGHGPTLVAFPHPSGTNRWFNSVQNRRAARKYLRRLFTQPTSLLAGR